MKYIMALDQGTTSSRCILFDKKGNMLSVAQKEFTQYYPQPAWVEHDANEIWESVLEVARKALDKIGAKAEDIISIGITNQRETTVIWDKISGEPIAHAIVWQCRRTSEIIDDLVSKGYSETIKAKTGLVPDAYFSGSKIKWLLDNVEGARERAERGELYFGTIDSWLIYKLTGGRVHVSDYTNASRTMLYNIHELKWDDELLELLDVPKCMLPEVKPSSYVYGETEPELFGGPIRIGAAAGDQQCALFGQCCFESGEMKNTYGTGCFLLMNTGHKAVASHNGLVTTIAASPDEHVSYALEGSIFIGGAAVQWLRDEMQVISSSKESESVASQVEDSEGAYVVPAFTGLGAPYWSQHARGAIVGLTRGFNYKHLVRATLESIAYETYDIVKAMEEDAGVPVKELKVDGGASANDLLMQFQADVIDAKVYRPSCIETTALGAAYLAGLAVGFYQNLEEIRENWEIDRIFEPHMEKEVREKKIRGWKKAVSTTLDWTEE
ncbi:MAG: glycerol kinase GlpK [Erysipelotrichaceae bacterium]|nr:glycerol kinase GlpK [Erysipelotrichaceae bacterium]